MDHTWETVHGLKPLIKLLGPLSRHDRGGAVVSLSFVNHITRLFANLL